MYRCLKDAGDGLSNLKHYYYSPQSPPAFQPLFTPAGAKEPCDATVFEPIPEPCEGNGSKNVQAKGVVDFC